MTLNSPDPNAPPPTTLVLHVSRRVVDVQGHQVAVPDRLFAMLELLAEGRVVSRTELTRAAQLEEQSPRRCESLLVELRRLIGTDTIRNLRRRGWILTTPAEIRQD